MPKLFHWSNWRAIAPPLTLCLIGLALWWRFGFEPLNDLEMPLAAFLNGLTGRNATFDWLVIFFNNWWGEALCVLVIFAGFAAVAAWAVPKPIDWRRVILFAGYTFVVWFVVNAVGDLVLEEYMPRDSPSLMADANFVNLEEMYETRIKTEARSSFPSNHGSVFFTVFFMCLMRFGWRAWVLLPLAIVLSSPRTFSGAHWMSDSLIGSVLVAWTLAAFTVRTPVYQVHKRIEESLCKWWDRKASSR